MLGKFEITNDSIVFEGRAATQPTTGAEQPTTPVDPGNVGNLLSDQFFGGGTLQGTIEFTDAKESACGLMLFYNPLNMSFIEAQLGGTPFASLMGFVNAQWVWYAQTGLGTQIVEGHQYKVRFSALGSSVSIWVDGVQVLATKLPFPLPRGQAGIWCSSKATIKITDFSVEAKQATAFVIMQFSTPYNELFTEVIRPVTKN